MPRPGSGLSQTRLDTCALLVARHPVGEADLIVRFFTESSGMVPVIARNARRSTKRFGALEPMHLLRVRIDSSPVRDLGTLTEARLERPRLGLTTRLGPMEAAGRALRWLRRAAPLRSAEPSLWHEVNGLLDRLDTPAAAEAGATEALLAASGLRLLAATGWGLELERCVRCGKPCPERSRAILDVAAGGIVCRECGGRGDVLGSSERLAMVDVMTNAAMALTVGGARALDLVDRALEIHGRGEAT
ncbi:MAG: DNA repair protein RecO [Deltaproteobacteria bacterium]|nr:DNA repair protein RecO [Deltaproteobacteria bacterium]